MSLAPIALFVYNRPWHTRQTVEALQKNILAEKTDLIIFSDGPKNFFFDKKTTETINKVNEVRNYIRTIRGFKSVEIIERQKNLGLADSIISGVTEVVNKYGKIIVLEDDMVTSPFFLKFMNDALNLYENEDKVISIHGYVYPIKGLPETFFLRGADCWGWATWKRGWSLFDPNGSKLLRALKEKNLLTRFDFDGAYPYTKMLKYQIKGKNNSWAIRWYASALLQDKLTLYPGKSLLQNIGTDASGTHKDNTNIFCAKLLAEPLILKQIPLVEDLNAYFEFTRFMKKISKELSPPNRIRRIIAKLL